MSDLRDLQYAEVAKLSDTSCLALELPTVIIAAFC